MKIYERRCSYHKERATNYKLEKKDNSSKEYCRLALIVEDTEDELYIDSGCSTHMTMDQNEFISLKKGKSGSVTFGNDPFVKILGKGEMNLRSEKVKATNVLLVEDLKHNLLTVNKMCDQGYTLTFNSQKFEIK